MPLKKLPFGIKLSTSDSGITILTKEFPGNNIGYMKLIAGAGSVQDSFFDLNGIAHVLEHAIFRGVKEDAMSIGPMILRNNHDISVESEGRAATINADNSYLSVSYTAEFYKSDFSALSEILFKVVMLPRLDDNDIRLEKNIVCAELAINRENPLFGDDEDKKYYCERMRELLFSRNPIRNRIGGRISEVKKIKPEQIRTAFDTFYSPSNMAFIVVGPFTHQEVARKIRELEKRYLHILSRKERQLPRLNSRNLGEKGLGETVRSFWQSDHFTHLTVNMAYRAPDTSDRDVMAIRILNGMLGSMEFSKLWEEFRNRRGNSYYADSRYFRTPIHGELRVHVDFFPKKRERYNTLLRVIQDFVVEELLKIQRGDVNRELFERTKAALYRFDRKISLEGPDDVGAMLVTCFEERTLNKDKPMDYVIRKSLEEALNIKRCSLKRVIDAANRHIDPHHYALVVSAPQGSF